jgi:F-type H+-transporting ATPase subunit b
MSDGGSSGRNTGAATAVAVVISLVFLYLLLFVLPGMIEPLNANITEIIVGLVCFGALYFVLAKVVFPVFERLYAERADKIEGGMSRAEELRAEAEELKQQYELQLADARAEAARIRDEARAEGAEVRAELRASADAEATEVRARAAEEISAQRATAQRSLHADLGSLSTQMAEKILGSRLQGQSPAVVDRYLSELTGASK